MNDQRRTVLRSKRHVLAPSQSLQSAEVTRFARQANQFNVLDVQKTNTANISTLNVKTKKVRKHHNVKLSGAAKRDPRFDLEVEFSVAEGSGAGDSYGNPLADTKANTEYYIRLRLRQHQAEPLLQGFSLAWKKPSGWAWVDGLGTSTYETAISNPTIVTRVCKSPGSLAAGSFRVAVTEKYA
jgi:hypothetical protein